MKKIITIAFALAVCTSASADELQIFSAGPGVPGLDVPSLLGMDISPNGDYICGNLDFGVGIFVADRATGEVRYYVPEIEDPEGYTLLGVDNDGFGVGWGSAYSYSTEEPVTFSVPEGYSYYILEGINSDGSVIVGSLKYSDTNLYGAYLKDKKDWTILPIPSDEELGIWIPHVGGSAAKFVSGDGKVIIGHLGSYEMPIIWKMNDNGEYEADFFFSRFVKGDSNDPDADSKPLYSISGHYLGISENGKYALMLGLMIDDNGRQHNVPVVYNTDTKTLKIYDEEQPIDKQSLGLYPRSIANDGTFIGCIGMPVNGSLGTFIMKAGTTVAESYEQAFPAYYEMLGMADYLGMNVPTGISADGRYLLGYTFYTDDYYDQSSDAYYLTYIIDRGEDVSVDEISSDAAPEVEGIYSLDGRRLSSKSSGINIIRMTDGSVKKVMVK